MSQKCRIELAFYERALLEEIGMPEMKRNDVALTYAMALRSTECKEIDWMKVNTAIIERWSRSALNYIKERAWGIAEGRVKPKPVT